jgi:hypothetical protein
MDKIKRPTIVVGPADLLVAAGATTCRPDRLQLRAARRISPGKKTIRRLPSFNFLRRRLPSLSTEIRSKGAVLAGRQIRERLVVFLAGGDPVRANLSQGLGVGLGEEVFEPGGRVQHLVAGGLVARLPSAAAAWLRRCSRVPSACARKHKPHIIIMHFTSEQQGRKKGCRRWHFWRALREKLEN